MLPFKKNPSQSYRLGLTKILHTQAPCSLGVECWRRRIKGQGSKPDSNTKTSTVEVSNMTGINN